MTFSPLVTRLHKHIFLLYLNEKERSWFMYFESDKIWWLYTEGVVQPVRLEKYASRQKLKESDRGEADRLFAHW